MVLGKYYGAFRLSAFTIFNRSIIVHTKIVFMKTLSLSVFICLLAGNISAQSLNKPAALLFKNVKTKLSAPEKNDIAKQLGFSVAKDGRQFTVENGEEYPFDAVAIVTDMNKDGKEEVFISFGNTYTSGMAGASIALYIKDASGKYAANLGFPGMVPDALTANTQGYPDLVIGGPGMEYPVWRWNGKEYAYNRTIKDNAYEKVKKTNVEDIGKAYAAAIK